MSTPSPDPLLRQTVSGRVRGCRVQASGGRAAWAWLGIPYAAPAAGPLRFRAPQPHAGWAGVREAVAFGPDMLQPLDPSVTFSPSQEGSLLLNIWTPARAAPPGGWPVLLWFHGGAFRGGSGRLYDGRSLASQGEAGGDVVVVTVNSRLGPLGYANFGGLYDDDRFAPNAGFQDQVAALRWVQANIAAFGGDPGRVTGAGESAGAVAVALMLTRPDTAALLAGAVLQSGALNQVGTWEGSLDTARAYATALGIRRENLNTLWSLPPSAFVGALHTLERVRPRRLNSRPHLGAGQAGQGSTGHLPASHATLLDAFAPRMPLLIGHNREEYSLFVRLPERVFPQMDRSLLLNWLDTFAPPEQVLSLGSHYPDTEDGLIALGTDMMFAAPADLLADRGRGRAGAGCWRYRFDWGTRFLGLGAAHGLELLFLWPRPMGLASATMRGGQQAARARLAATMQAAWLDFVRSGSPGPGWSPSVPEQRVTNVLSLDGLGHDHTEEQARRGRWRGLLTVMP